MPEFNPLLARRVVTDLGRTHNAIDAALKKLANLTTDVLEVFGDAQLSDETTQPSLQDIAQGFSAIVAGRGAFVQVHQRLIEMKMESNLRSIEIGCVAGPICKLNAETTATSPVSLVA